MPDDRSRRSHSIFMRLLDVDTSEREAFLSTACAGDVELKQRVQSLMEAMDHSTKFLEMPALGTRTGSDNAPAVAADSISVRGYRVLKVLGVGGMASVYEAVQEQPERTVALKVMSRALTNTSAVRRFRYETKVLGRLQHPGIAQIFEAGTCDDGQGQPLPYFAMELVPGARTLTEHATAEKLTLHERLELFAAVCDAVQHGHQLGVIHRDLKPANILVDASGRTRIIDFGVARSTDQDLSEMTRRADIGQLVGTLNFMSPEQCRATNDVDARTDVYSLGVILYQLLAGRLPHDLSNASIPEAVRVITQDEPARLATIMPAARGDLDAIVMTAIEKDPARRYNGAAALAADIRRYLNHKTIDARPPSVMHQARLFARRHRMVVGAGAAVLVTMVAASIVIAAMAYRATREANRRFRAEQAALKQRDAACQQAYIASIAGAFTSNQLGDLAQSRRRLSMAPPYLRNWEWRLLAAIIERGESRIHAHEEMVLAFAMSPDSKRLATGSRDGGIAIWDAEKGDPVTAMNLASGSSVFSVSFTADGRHLVTGSGDRTVRVWEATSGALTREIDGHKASVESVACSASGLIATASLDGVAHLWSLDAAEPLKRFDDQAEGVQGVTFSPDGSRLVTWNRRGSIWVRTGDGSTVLHRLKFDGTLACVVVSPDNSMIAAGGADGRIRMWSGDGTDFATLTTTPSISTVRSLAFSADSKLLASGQIDRAIRIWDVESRSTREVRLGHEEAVSGLAFNPSGDRLYSASWDRTLRIWPVGDSSPARTLSILNGHLGHALAVAFSPDGSLIASGGRDNVVRLWDATLGEELTQLRGHEDGVYGVAFSPDGAMIATASDDGTTRLWSTATGREIESLGPPGKGLWSVTFSPDGAFVASAGDAGIVRVWDTKQHKNILEFSAHDTRITTVKYSPDGATLATASRDGTVKLWNASTGAHKSTLKGHGADVFSVIFSPDGTKVFSGSRDQTVRVWNAASGEAIQTLDSQGQLITSLSISPDGTRLAAGSWFTEIVLWDLPTLELIASFKGHNSAIRSLAFSPDGCSLASAGHDGTIMVYNATPKDQRSQELQRARAARAAAHQAIDRLRSAGMSEEALIDALDKELAHNPDARRWARNFVLMRGSGTAVDERLPE